MITIAGQALPMQAPLEEDWDRVGDAGRTYSGAAWSQVRAEKRTWSGVTSYLEAADLATLRAATAEDAVVEVVDTLRSITINAMVRIRPALTVTTLYTVALTMREV